MATGRGMTRPGVAAALLAAYAVLCLVLGAAVVLFRPEVVGDHPDYWLLSAVSVLNLVLVVTLVARRPGHAITVALGAGVLLSMTGNGPALLAIAVSSGHGGAAGAIGGALSDLAWLGGIPFLPLLFVLFPDGWPQGRWRWVARADVTALGLLALVSVLRHVGLDIEPVLMAVAVTSGVTLALGAFAAGTRLGIRVVRERRAHRENTAFAAVAVLILLLYLTYPLLSALLDLPATQMPVLAYAGLAFGPQMAIGYGVLRHHLFELDIVIRRVALASAAYVLILAMYLAAALAMGLVFGLSRSALAAALLPAALVVAVLAPLHQRLRRLVERRLYGDRRDPHVLLLHLAGDLALVAPEDVPSLVATRCAAGLRLPWVAVELDREGALVEVAATGTRSDAALMAVELRHVGELVGRLVTQPRRGQVELGGSDRRALEQVAGQAAPALSAARLVDELTASRERLVQGREAERARLRRELHDGLSPSLAGMSLALGAARRSLGDIPPEADQLLTTVQRESTSAWSAVRDLLSDLRPPGLEELGLVGALEDRARQLGRPEDFRVWVAARELPPLPSAVEVAAYRIATEAMTNAARHSGGHSCRVDISANGRLEITVSDDGSGFGTDGPVKGVGLESMAERARELGGDLMLERGAEGGTVVHALLPLSVAT